MPLLTLASDFLAGSLLTLVLPLALLIAIVIWYMAAVKRVPRRPSKREDAATLGVDSDASPGPADGAPPASTP